MIKATGLTGSGKPLVILGLSGENMTRLMANEPIPVNLRQLGLPEIYILIVSGRTEKDIVDHLNKTLTECGLEPMEGM